MWSTGRLFVASSLLLAALALQGCSSLDPIERPAAVTGSADFSSYVALGTSISMGIQSNGLVEDFQRNSFPALVADATAANGGSFTQPLVATPGIPPVLEVVGFSPTTGVPILAPRPGTPPTAPTTPRPADGYDNLGISGAVVANALAKLGGDPPTNYFDLVLQGQGTAIRQCLAQQPTFVSVEYGSNELVAGLVRGDPTIIPATALFRTLYTQLLDSLATGAPDAKLVLVNAPEVTDVAYATAIPLDLNLPIGPGGSLVAVRLRDTGGPLPDGARILLPAAALLPLGYGLPAPAPPLPDSLVITLPERAVIEALVDEYNAAIADLAAQRGAALADFHGAFARAHTNGVLVGGVRYGTSYVSGGLFSFDGLHPSSLGQGLIANEVIRAVNAKFGASIPPVDLAPLTESGSAVAAVQARDR